MTTPSNKEAAPAAAPAASTAATATALTVAPIGATTTAIIFFPEPAAPTDTAVASTLAAIATNGMTDPENQLQVFEEVADPAVGASIIPNTHCIAM